MKLAELANLSTGFGCDIEREVKWGTPETFIKISTALNVSPFELLLPCKKNSNDKEDTVAIKRAKQKTAKELSELIKKNIANLTEKFIASCD